MLMKTLSCLTGDFSGRETAMARAFNDKLKALGFTQIPVGSRLEFVKDVDGGNAAFLARLEVDTAHYQCSIGLTRWKSKPSTGAPKVEEPSAGESERWLTTFDKEVTKMLYELVAAVKSV